jgi:hypothetical protein
MTEPQATFDNRRMPGSEGTLPIGGLSRYFHERKPSIRDRAITVAVTLLVLLIGFAGWRYFSQRRLGRIILINQGPPLSVQVLPDTGDEPIDEPFDLVTRRTLALPEGDYRLRVNAVGRLGRTYRFAVNRGETIEHELSLDEGRLLGRDLDPSDWAGQDKPREEPMPFALVTRALELNPGRCDIVELNGKSVVRRDSITGEVVWDTANPKTPYGPARDPGPWLRRIGPNRRALHVSEPAVDLNGDGTRDVLIAVRSYGNGFFALSGQDGSMLWNYVAELDGPGGPQADGPNLPEESKPEVRSSGLVGSPAIGDVDGDGAPDLIATLVFYEVPAEIQRRTGKPFTPHTDFFERRIITAISGRSGRWLWTFPIERSFSEVKTRYEDRSAALLRGRKTAHVVILDGSQAIVLDALSGRSRSAPIDLGFEPLRAVQFADFDSDGEPDMVGLGPAPSANQQLVKAFSMSKGITLWTVTINGKYASRHENQLQSEWSWLIDLDRDGRSEVIAPVSGPMQPASGFRGLQVLDGATGKTRWSRPMRPDTKARDGLVFTLVAPDFDGDGVSELIALSRFDGRNPPASRNDCRWEPERVYVDGLSGRNGQLLWTWHMDVPEDKFVSIHTPLWWGRGPDGWPMLAVPLGGQDPDDPGPRTRTAYLYPPTVHVLEASTGRELSRVMGLAGARVADLDGDGLLDLWGEVDGQLRAFRGEPPEVWRALGRFPPAWNFSDIGFGNIKRGAFDLDGDGIPDNLSGEISFTGDSNSEPKGSRTAIARSGLDGHVLWKTVLDPPWLWFWPEPARSYILDALALPAGDLDGDGKSDVVVREFTDAEKAFGRLPATPLQLLSGSDGRHLWSVGCPPLSFEPHGFSNVSWFEPRVIEPNAQPDLLVIHRNPFLKPGPTSTTSSPRAPGQERMARVSGRTGQILWDVALQDQATQQTTGEYQTPKVDDLDGDGRLDAGIVVRQLAQTGKAEFDLKVISLRDGASRWTRLIHYQGFKPEYPQFKVVRGAPNSPATVFVVELPSTVELSSTKTSNELIVHAIDGRSGIDRWTWRSGVGKGSYWAYGAIDPIALDRDARDSICVTYSDGRRECCIVILDRNGQERVRRVLPPERVPKGFPPVADYMLDLDGDGRDELIVWNDNRLQAWSRDLKEQWSIPTESYQILRFLPACSGRPSTLLLPPATAIDGTSGRVRWALKPSPLRKSYAGDLLDPGDATRLPRLVSVRHHLVDTVCRLALPTTPRGDYAPPSGARPQPGLARDDPRWTRPLPWTILIDPQTLWTGFFAVVGVALLNVFLPLGILRFAAYRRPWSLRALMALPVAAAVPLTAFPALKPLIPIPPPTAPLPSSPLALFALGTLAGVPVVGLVAITASSLLRRRWRTFTWLAGLTVVASVAIAAAWLWVDMRRMPAIEHYSRSGWYLAVVAGAFLASVLMLVGEVNRRTCSWLTRRAVRS